MKRQTIPLGRIFNIPIGLDYSWFLIFILLTWSLATSYYPAEFKTWSTILYWTIGAATTILLFVSVLLHELGHSVVAQRYRVPVRSITLFIFGGVAQIAAEPPNAAADLWIAIAGPIVSFALAGLFGLIQSAFTSLSPLLALMKYLALINGSLALFNLIPGFPLDGGRVLRAVVWQTTHNYRRATLVAATTGRMFAFLFIIYGVWQMFSGNLAGGLWIAFIGWFLDSAATSHLQQQTLRDLLAGHKVWLAMTQNYTVIPSDLTLQQLADEHILGMNRRFFVIKNEGQVLGLITLHNIKEVPRSKWAETKAAENMIPAAQMHQVRPETELWNALEQMDKDGVNQLPVMVNGTLLGILTRESIISFLGTLQEIKKSESSEIANDARHETTADQEMIMDIPMKAEVRCSDGLCGHTTCIIVDPITQTITHVVVKEKQSPHTERLVPEDYILEATPESLHLKCNCAELSMLDEFVEYHFTRVEIPRYYPAGYTVFWPYAVVEETTLVSQDEHIPPNELAIHRMARVIARDGVVGRVDEFLVDPIDGKITHLILREGHLWGQKDVTIPVSQIDHWEADTAYLKLDKNSIERLPAIPVRRWSL
jgi:Zn-dependent protease/CBS domain-containing protein